MGQDWPGAGTGLGRGGDGDGMVAGDADGEALMCTNPTIMCTDPNSSATNPALIRSNPNYFALIRTVPH